MNIVKQAVDIPGGVFDCLYDEYFTLLEAKSICIFLGYTQGEMAQLFHNHLIDCVCEEDRDMILEEIRVQLSAGNVFMHEIRMNTKSGEVRWAWISAEHRETEEHTWYLHCIFRDITRARKDQEQLSMERQRYEIVLSQMQDIVFELDCNTFDIYYSPSFEKKFGYQIPVKGFPDSMFKTDIIHEEDKDELRQKFQSLLRGNMQMEHEYRIKHMDGHYIWVDVHATAMRDADGTILSILGIISDIHKHKTEILETKRMASLDALTGLLNRRECIQRISQYIEDSDSLAALIIIDIDDFKRINDTMGHLRGDTVLSAVADGLLSIFRRSDIVSRFGGDEFVIFMPQLREKDNVNRKLDCILSFFQHNTETGTPVSCSIGVCFYPEHGSNFTSLFAKADAAMYHAKKHEKGSCYIYKNEDFPSRGLLVSRNPFHSMQKNVHDHIIESIFRIFLENPDVRSAIPVIFDYIGRIFHSDRMYICQRSDEGIFETVYYWCSSGTQLEKESLDRLYSFQWKMSGDIPATTIHDTGRVTDPQIRGWLEERKVKAIFLCWLGDMENGSNIIGFEDCHNSREDTGEERYTIFMVSELLNLFLVKEYNARVLEEQSRERISFFMDSIPGGMLGMYLQEDFPLYFINPRMLEFLGFSDQAEYTAFIDGNASNGIYEEDRDTVTAHIRNSLRDSDEYEIEYRMLKKNGELMWVNDKGRKIHAPKGKEAVISLCIDISEQKEYENQLAIYRNASNGGAFVMSMDRNYTLLYANDIFYDVFETSKEDLETMERSAVSFIHPDDRALAIGLLEEARAGHRAYFQWEIRIITGRGNQKCIMVNASFERQEDDLVMNGFVIDVTEKHHLEDEIAHKELVYRTALRETHINVWEYDVKHHTLILSESAEEHHVFKGRLEGVPESLLEKEYVHPSSSQDLIEMYLKLNQGEPYVQADILTRSADLSGWWWERINYTTLYDDEGCPLYAVAVGEDVTQQKESEALYQQEMQLRMAMNEGMILSFRCNLEENHVDYVNGPDTDQYGKTITYDDLLGIQSLYIANQEDQVRFMNMMSRTALCDAYQKGSSCVSCEYRRKGRDGRLYWVSASARMMRSVQDGSLYIYGTLQDIDERKTIELTLKRRAERDSLTDTYNKDTAIRMMEEMIHKEQQRGKSFAMLVFNVDHFTQMVKDSGYTVADSILKELGSQLVTRSSHTKIVGRFYGDEFVVLLYDSPSRETVVRYGQDVRKAMNQPYMFPGARIPVSISAGIVFGDEDTDAFYDLYQNARTALAMAKAGGRNSCLVYSQGMEEQILLRELECLDTLRQPASRDKTEENILLKCLLSLTGTVHFRKAMEDTLENVAQYYDSDRAYVVELERDRVGQENIYEWKKPDVDSIYSFDTGRFPLQNLLCLDSERHMQLQYIENVDTLENYDSDLCQGLRERGVSSFFLAGLEENGVVMGYISIDNPGRNTGNINIISSLHYFLANELTKRRLQKQQEYLSGHDEMTGLLNRSSYKRYCEDLREEGLISLGVISLDINGLKEINRNHGNSYGDDMVRYIGNILKEELPSFRIYRFTGDEFLAICENMAYDAFENIMRVTKERLNNACSTSMGAAWSDTDMSISSLLNSADERRLIAKQTYYDERQFSHAHKNTQTLNSLLKALSQNKFLIYLQPKIDSRDNNIYGAEALVRYYDPATGLVSPGKFIQYLESSNLIHHIDFFVLEEVCRIREEWRQQGLSPVPVSLNFSRSTLLEENLISRIDEIVDRYHTDRQGIEIEITESLGEVERTTITEIGGQILQYGCRLSLDDFGSKYSNLSFLSTIHFHTLKLDKGLVNNIISNENARVIVKNILNLCRELDIEVVAEGVEEYEQLKVLKDMQCWYIQGYYYNKPLPVHEFESLYLGKK